MAASGRNLLQRHLQILRQRQGTVGSGCKRCADADRLSSARLPSVSCVLKTKIISTHKSFPSALGPFHICIFPQPNKMGHDVSTGIIEFILDHFTEENEGTYTCQITDGGGKGQSSLVLIGDGKAGRKHGSTSDESLHAACLDIFTCVLTYLLTALEVRISDQREATSRQHHVIYFIYFFFLP